MATIPGREQACKEAVASIINQVDELHVHFNDPNDPENDFGDAAKFKALELCKPGDIYVSLDDDLIYPEYTVVRMVDFILRKNEELGLTLSTVAACYHGRTLANYPASNYYTDRTSVRVRILGSLDAPARVEVPGTGCMAYRVANRPFDVMEAFERKDSADIAIAALMKEEGIEAWALPHQAGDFRHSPHVATSNTIWATADRDEITEYYNRMMKP